MVRRVEVVEEVRRSTSKGEHVTLIKGVSYPWVGRGMTADNTPAYQIAVDGEVGRGPAVGRALVVPKVQLISQAVERRGIGAASDAGREGQGSGRRHQRGRRSRTTWTTCATRPTTNRPDYVTLLRDATGGRLDMKQFNAQMAMELAAQRMLIMSQGGLYARSARIALRML